MSYVEGFVLPLPKKNLSAYRRLARLAARVWMEHGALEYRECVLESRPVKGMKSFPALARVRRGETVLFSWIVYRSKAHRKRVFGKVMADPRMDVMSQEATMPFDVRRMAYGGFKVLVAR